MTDDREMELISAAMDRELDVADHAALKQLLESSAEARELRDELDQLDTVLKGVPELDPPASLHAQIMSRANPTPSRDKPSMSDWFATLIPGTGLRYALAASTGALVAAVFINSESILPGPGDTDELVGTVAPDESSATTDVIDSFSFSYGGLGSDVQLERSNGALSIDIRVVADVPLDITVNMSGSGLQADAVAQMKSSFESITLTEKAVGMRAVGEQSLTILLRRVDDAALAEKAKITLEFSSGGKLLQQGVLKPTW